ncbi:hypothetical protein ABBQ32_004784 [Trebouxia sp. C0010 RCD-2024]
MREKSGASEDQAHVSTQRASGAGVPSCLGLLNPRKHHRCSTRATRDRWLD